jgi:hypothetical protein
MSQAELVNNAQRSRRAKVRKFNRRRSAMSHPNQRRPAEKVLGLQIAMHDAAAVQVCDGREQLESEQAELAVRHGPARCYVAPKVARARLGPVAL